MFCKSRTRRSRRIPEVEYAVGKLGRMDSPLDPAPISMIETLMNYKSEYARDPDGQSAAISICTR